MSIVVRVTCVILTLCIALGHARVASTTGTAALWSHTIEDAEFVDYAMFFEYDLVAVGFKNNTVVGYNLNNGQFLWATDGCPNATLSYMLSMRPFINANTKADEQHVLVLLCSGRKNGAVWIHNPITGKILPYGGAGTLDNYLKRPVIVNNDTKFFTVQGNMTDPFDMWQQVWGSQINIVYGSGEVDDMNRVQNSMLPWLDRATGALGITPVPQTDGDVLFVAPGQGLARIHTIGVDATGTDKDVRWTVNTPRAAQAKYEVAISPLDKTLGAVALKNTTTSVWEIVGLNITTGKELWSSSNHNPAFAVDFAPQFTVDGKYIMVSLNGGRTTPTFVDSNWITLDPISGNRMGEPVPAPFTTSITFSKNGNLRIYGAFNRVHVYDERMMALTKFTLGRSDHRVETIPLYNEQSGTIIAATTRRKVDGTRIPGTTIAAFIKKP